MARKLLLHFVLSFLVSDCLRLNRNDKVGLSRHKLSTLQNKTQHWVQRHDNLIETMDPQLITSVLIGVAFLLVILVGFVMCWGPPSQADRPVAHLQESPLPHVFNVSVTMIRLSGQRIATLNAKSDWCAIELEQELSVHLAPNEHVHSIQYLVGTSLERLTKFSSLGRMGIKDGAEMRAIIFPCCVLPSGVSLFSYEEKMSGLLGARKVAKLWVHADNSVNLEYGEVLDIDKEQTTRMCGALADEGSLQFQEDGQTIEGTIGGSGKRIPKLNLPRLGDVELEEEVVDAVFYIGRTSAFSGWLTLFRCSELVVKLEEKTSESMPPHVAHLRFQLCTQSLPDGSLKLFCAQKFDFATWEEVKLEDCDISWSATLKGPVGCRKLILVDFPFIGNLEVTEHLFCSELAEAWKRHMQHDSFVV